MQNLSKNILSVICFISVFSFLNLQKVEAVSFLDSFFSRIQEAIDRRPEEERPAAWEYVNQKFTAILPAFITNYLNFAGIENVTQDISVTEQEKAEKDPVCNADNYYSYNYEECENLKSKAKALDEEKARLKSLGAATNGGNGSSGSSAGTQGQAGSDNGQTGTGGNGQRGLGGVSDFGNNQTGGNTGSTPFSGQNPRTGDTTDDKQDSDKLGQIPPGLENVEITAQCQQKYADLGPGCSSLPPLKPIVVLSLKQACSVLGKPVPITSAHRTDDCNRKVGGAPKSQHKEGIAVDIVPSQIGDIAKQLRVFLIFKKNGAKGIGCYNINKVHIDFRSTEARWGSDYTKDTFKASNCPAALLQAFK
jgi:hypothetical protein